MVSGKESIERLVKICEEKGITRMVLSPGSRNAPLVISFDEHPDFECVNIIDERAAGFFALGMSQFLRAPVILCCTSGSALLNYGPALVEAYYQQIPLIVMSADRPMEWIDQRAGQTMRQKGVFDNYIKRSFNLIGDPKDPDHLMYNDRLVNEAIEECQEGPQGPVHINIPLQEPLYEVKQSVTVRPKIVKTLSYSRKLTSGSERELLKHWVKMGKILVLIGQGDFNNELSESVDWLAQQRGVVVLTESTSNIRSKWVFPCIDRLIDSLTEDEKEIFSPDLLLTFGNSIVSKKIRFLLRKMEIGQHWHISETDRFVDTFQSLTYNIPTSPRDFIRLVREDASRVSDESFGEAWSNRNNQVAAKHIEYLSTSPWSDLFVFKTVLDALPPNSILHLANSTPIRYVQLFESRTDIEYYSNRGVSGIDGCTSTAAGFAWESDQIVTIITGDLAFFYDSNGLWHNHIRKNLRIILINNEGGGIFRFIPGPSTTNQFERHFETHHKTTAKHLAATMKISYQSVDNSPDLNIALSSLYKEDVKSAQILEIRTPREENDVILKNYFNYLKSD